MIERAPFRGNGFAPGETGDVIAEFKVDSVRLPHGAQMWRLTRDGQQSTGRALDADGPRWALVDGLASGLDSAATPGSGLGRADA